MVIQKQISVAVVDDHRLVRDLLRLVLGREESIRIVGEAANRIQVMSIISDQKPDVLLVNSTLLEMNAAEFIASVRLKSPDTRILMISDKEEDDTLFYGLKSGVRGCISMDMSSSNLVKAIRTVHRGEVWVKRKLIARFFDGEAAVECRRDRKNEAPEGELTPREKDILRCLATGCSNKNIGETLFISDKTVKCHLNNIFKKIQVSHRLEASLYAINKGLA